LQIGAIRLSCVKSGQTSSLFDPSEAAFIASRRYAAKWKPIDAAFWIVGALYLPIALLGNWVGLRTYQKTGELGYRKITLFALAFSGAGLLLKTAIT
jgi:hypothetical protein